jgi:hypothetical protein
VEYTLLHVRAKPEDVDDALRTLSLSPLSTATSFGFPPSGLDPRRSSASTDATSPPEPTWLAPSARTQLASTAS